MISCTWSFLDECRENHLISANVVYFILFWQMRCASIFLFTCVVYIFLFWWLSCKSSCLNDISCTSSCLQWHCVHHPVCNNVLHNILLWYTSCRWSCFDTRNVYHSALIHVVSIILLWYTSCTSCRFRRLRLHSPVSREVLYFNLFFKTYLVAVSLSWDHLSTGLISLSDMIARCAVSYLFDKLPLAWGHPFECNHSQEYTVPLYSLLAPCGPCLLSLVASTHVIINYQVPNKKRGIAQSLCDSGTDPETGLWASD